MEWINGTTSDILQITTKPVSYTQLDVYKRQAVDSVSAAFDLRQVPNPEAAAPSMPKSFQDQGSRMDYEPIAIIATFAFFYSVLAARFQHSKFGGAVAFMGFGLAMGPVGLGLLTINGTSSDFRAIAEITLALVLFADASQADMSVLRRSFRIPGRLILILSLIHI